MSTKATSNLVVALHEVVLEQIAEPVRLVYFRVVISLVTIMYFSVLHLRVNTALPLCSTAAVQIALQAVLFRSFSIPAY